MRSPVAADFSQRRRPSTHSHRYPARRRTSSRHARCSGVRSSGSALLSGGLTVRVSIFAMRGRTTLTTLGNPRVGVPAQKAPNLVSVPRVDLGRDFVDVIAERRKEARIPDLIWLQPIFRPANDLLGISIVVPHRRCQRIRKPATRCALEEAVDDFVLVVRRDALMLSSGADFPEIFDAGIAARDHVETARIERLMGDHGLFVFHRLGLAEPYSNNVVLDRSGQTMEPTNCLVKTIPGSSLSRR